MKKKATPILYDPIEDTEEFKSIVDKVINRQRIV